jgi:hypothetical protein
VGQRALLAGARLPLLGIVDAIYNASVLLVEIVR